MNRQQWCQRLFQSIDGKRTGEFLGFLTPDARFRFGSAPAVQGEAAIAAAVDRFFASVASLSHRVLDLWETPGHLICRGEVHYQRLDGRSVQVPFCDVLALHGEKITRYEIYLDPTPLAAD
jgi:ketosteroid isomerase-like protein